MNLNRRAALEADSSHLGTTSTFALRNTQIAGNLGWMLNSSQQSSKRKSIVKHEIR